MAATDFMKELFTFTINPEDANTRARVSIRAKCVFCSAVTFVDEQHPCAERTRQSKERTYEPADEPACSTID